MDSFYKDIQGDIESNGGGAELIILGDFMDVIRSTEWKEDVQPWESADKIKNTVESIVNNIIGRNSAVFNIFKKYFSPNITYVIGNHDRLINSDNGYDEIREKIRNALGLKAAGEKFQPEYKLDNLIYGEHGHRYDVYNKIENDVLPIGDAIVTLLINRYPDEVNGILKDPEVYEALQEIDNLRPSTIAPYWIDHVKELLPTQKQDILKKVWNDLSDKFFENRFVKNWFNIYDRWSIYFDDADKLEVALKHFTETATEKLYEKYLEIKKDFIRETDQNAVEALKLIERHKFDYVLFGHTHESCVHLLDAEEGKEKYYINTGTWRDRIVPGGYKRKGIVFGHQKSVDYAIFSIDDRNGQVKGFQLWNGTVKED